MRSRNTRMDGEVRRWVRVCRTHTYPTYDKHEFKNHQDVRVETNRESRPIGSVRSRGCYGTMRRRLFSVSPPLAKFCRLLSLARADTHTRPTTHIHLSVLLHGGCRPDLRPKRGAFWLCSRLPGGRATWFSSISTSSAGTPPSCF